MILSAGIVMPSVELSPSHPVMMMMMMMMMAAAAAAAVAGVIDL